MMELKNVKISSNSRVAFQIGLFVLLRLPPNP